MLKVFACECGFTQEMEHSEYYNKRIECPRCRIGHVHVGSSSKCTGVFEDSIRLLSRRQAEKAAEGFAQGYEIWLKHVIDGRDAGWLRAYPRAGRRALIGKVKALFGLDEFTPIEKGFRNSLEHDPSRLATVAEASAYADHVVETMEKNLAELMGSDVWRKGEAGELAECSSDDPEPHVNAFLRYWHHYRSGNIGYVKTVRTWWTANKEGQSDWHQASW